MFSAHIHRPCIKVDQFKIFVNNSKFHGNSNYQVTKRYLKLVVCTKLLVVTKVLNCFIFYYRFRPALYCL